MGGDSTGIHAHGAASPQPHSPRDDPSLLDAALGYYALLDHYNSGQSNALPDTDEYDQLDFEAALTGNAQARKSFDVMQRLHTARKLSASAARRLRKQVRKRYSALRRPIAWTRRRVLLRDKGAFVLGVFHIIASAYWLGYAPSTFYRLYTAKATLLLGLRLALYRRDKMHYYLLDFCYYANALMLLHVWALPEACDLQKVLFAFAMGPLAWSIILFRNSLIFHSLDKMTSVFLHAFPPLVAWAMRWHAPDAQHWKGDAATAAACAARPASVRELILIPWLPYALWAVFYYLKIFVISSKKIQAQGYHTLFRYMTRKPNTFFGQLARKLPRWASPLVFMGWHVLFCAVTFVLTWAMWQSYVFNTVFLVTMTFMSAWNGGNYYFEVFARKYLEEVETTSKAAAAAADARAGGARRSHSEGAPLAGDSDTDAVDTDDEGGYGGSDDGHLPRVVRASSDGALASRTNDVRWRRERTPPPVLGASGAARAHADTDLEHADFSSGLVHAQDAARSVQANGTNGAAREGSGGDAAHDKVS